MKPTRDFVLNVRKTFGAVLRVKSHLERLIMAYAVLRSHRTHVEHPNHDTHPKWIWALETALRRSQLDFGSGWVLSQHAFWRSHMLFQGGCVI